MDSPLHILLVDDRPDSILFLSEFLLGRKQRVEICNDAQEAIAAVLRRRRTGDPYDLVISNVLMAGLDGVGLLRELRRRQETVDVVLYTTFADINPSVYQEAEKLDCLTFLDKPIDLRRVEDVLVQVRVRRRRLGPASGHGLPGGAPAAPRGDQEQPFFGTARVVRPAGGATTRYVPPDTDAHPATRAHGTTGFFPERPAPTTTARVDRGVNRTDRASERTPLPGSLGRTHVDRGANRSDRASERTPLPGSISSGKRPGTHPLTSPRTSDRLRAQSAAPGSTSRIRRSVTGRIGGPPPVAGVAAPVGDGRRVLCAACKKEFVVAMRMDPFNAICVHCGQLNRVDPRSNA